MKEEIFDVKLKSHSDLNFSNAYSIDEISEV